MRWLAFAGFVLTLAVVVASAWLRHGQAGVECAGWPACYGRIALPEASGAATARLVHRVSAIGVLLVAIAALVLAYGRRGATRGERYAALAALALVIALAVLGIATPGSRRPIVVLGNLLGGYALLATFAALAATTWRPADGFTLRASHDRRPGAAWRLAIALFALGALVAAGGGLIGANFAVDACTGLVDCGGIDWTAFARGGALDPLRPWTVVDGRVVAPAGVAGLHALHRIAGVALAAGALLLAFLLRRHAALAALLALGALAVPLAGVLDVLALPSRPATIVHNATAALIFAALATAMVRARR